MALYPLHSSKQWYMSTSAAGGFTGSVKDFVAAGDSVLLRIKHHMNEGLHLSETRHRHRNWTGNWRSVQVSIAPDFFPE